MSQRFRAAAGGHIEREQPLRFRFDGQSLQGYRGDTLASALLANGVRVVGRSFKYHRPRGIVGSGAEEPNAMVTLGSGPRQEPNLRATQVELFDGLTAVSQNRWPSLDWDVSAINNLLSPLLPAGFYYKTFMWPASWWMRYEYLIRRAAGLGVAAREPDVDRYQKRYAHCDLLVVGAGAAGLMAALSAARSGVRVTIVDENPEFGGALRWASEVIDEQPAWQWVQACVAELTAMSNVRMLKRATAFGYYDQNLVAVSERCTDHIADPPAFEARQRIWWIRAQRVVLATGALERPLVFAGNDRPGVMLASAAAGYAVQYAVQCGKRAVLFTNNDSAYESLPALQQAGVDIAGVVDARVDGPGTRAAERASHVGGERFNGYLVVRTRGSKALSAVTIMRRSGGQLSGDERQLECDLLCVSGGWNPTVHLFSQSQGKLRYDAEATCFVPDESRQAERSVGACRGVFDLSNCLTDGTETGVAMARELGANSGVARVPAVAGAVAAENPIEALWLVPTPGRRRHKRFVDFQNDVTADDLGLAAREGYRSVEHVKRYTTLGMGTDQGRTSNVNGLALLAATLGKDITDVGTTTFRPPYTPVTMGALAAGETGSHFAPVRRTAMHDWHLRAGAQMVNAGVWQRAQFYAQPGESMMDAINRETKNVRTAVGVVDVSTLGKIEIQGRDAAEFLERVYINRWKSLKVGRCRYGLMLREDGLLMDDGTTTRVAEHEYYMTTTTASAGPVMQHLEFYAQTVWPELHVHLTSITDQWAGLALAGPYSRDVLAAVLDGAKVDNEALPYMGFVEAFIAGMPVRVFRITFSGELAYEIHIPSDYGEPVWQAVLDAGENRGIMPYGTEALSVLRIEKGHIVGAELDGRTVPADFGFGRMQRQDSDFVGKRSLERPAFNEPRAQLVGLVSQNGRHIPRGAQLLQQAEPTVTPANMLGHITSTCYSPNLEQEIALGLLQKPGEYNDRILYAVSPLAGESVPVKLTNPVFIDPEGVRARG